MIGYLALAAIVATGTAFGTLAVAGSAPGGFADFDAFRVAPAR